MDLLRDPSILNFQIFYMTLVYNQAKILLKANYFLFQARKYGGFSKNSFHEYFTPEKVCFTCSHIVPNGLGEYKDEA